MGEWQQTTLGEVCESSGGSIQTGPFGSQLHASDYVEHGIPSVMPQNIGDNRVDTDGIAMVSDDDAARLSKYALREGDIVYSRRGDVERRALVRKENTGWLCGTGCLRVRIDDQNRYDPRFISYALGLDESRAWISRHAVGATMLNLNTSILSSVPLTVPEVDEQRAIGDVLSALDDKIAANEGAAGLAVSLIDALHHTALISAPRTSRLLFDVFHIDYGEAFKGGEFTPPGAGRPLIRIRDLTRFKPQVWTTERRPREVMVQPGDVVVGMDAEFRANWWLGEPGLLNQRVCRVRGRTTGSAFAAEALRKPLAAIENEKTGTTVIHLNKSDLERSKIEVPAPGPLAEFEAKAEPLLRSRVAMALENRILAATRDELLPLLMSGKLRVRDAEKAVEEVV